jgi:hypothetical protein
MKKTIMTIFLVIAAIMVVWAIVSYLVIRSIEKPSYTVLETKKGFEIREYQPYLLAQTEVGGEMRDALTSGFSIVANYIFGDNTKKQSIAMTSPVVESESEKIAMTSPVLEEEKESSRLISFILPSKYTLESLPEPNDSRVKIVKIPKRKVAVLRFTWYPTNSRVDAKKAQLLEYVNNAGLQQVGPVETALYNPPLSFPLSLRNEVWVPVN